MWTAYYQADGEHRHTIAVRRLKHTAVFEAEKFIARMTNPDVGVWWVWLEGDTNEDIASGDDRGAAAVRNSDAKFYDSRSAETDSGNGR